MSTEPSAITRMSSDADALLDQAKRLHLAETLVAHGVLTIVCVEFDPTTKSMKSVPLPPLAVPTTTQVAPS